MQHEALDKTAKTRLLNPIGAKVQVIDKDEKVLGESKVFLKSGTGKGRYEVAYEPEDATEEGVGRLGILTFVPTKRRRGCIPGLALTSNDAYLALPK